MKVVFDNLANFLSFSPNQTLVFAACLPGPSWTFLPFLFHIILYSLPYSICILCTMYMFSHPHVQYSMWSAVLWIYGHSCTHAFLLWDPNTHPLKFWMISAETPCWEIERNSQIFNEDFYLPLYLPLWPVWTAPAKICRQLTKPVIMFHYCKLECFMESFAQYEKS